MLKLFDTHCHFETTDREVIRATLARAKAAGVEKIMAVGGSPTLNEAAEEAGRESKSGSGELPIVVLAKGLDRDQVGESSVFNFQSSVFSDGIAAIGEIGLDYHYSPDTRKEQINLFAAQLEEARKRDLPVVIHTREADDDTLGLLREIPSRGVIHCYTGTPEAAKQFLDLGFYISISGIVTFKAAQNVRDSAMVVPDDRILIETDSPYLAPVPMRGNPNEPAFIKHTCEFLASLRGVPAEELADVTYANGCRMLGEKF